MEKKKIWIVILALAIVVLLGGAYLLYDKLADQVDPENIAVDEEPGAAEKSKEADRVLAPDFAVVDSQGQTVRLWELRGKPVVLNFWASWCGPCKSEMPDFDAAYQEYGDRVTFLMVNLTDGSRETLDTAQSYLQEQGFSFPGYFDIDQEAAIAYGVSAIPTTYFIDADGYAIAQAKGALDADRLQTGLARILPQE